MKVSKINNKIIIIGAGGHGRVVADIALNTGSYTYIAFIDDNPFLKKSMGIDVIDNTDGIPKYIGGYDFAVAIGDNDIRETFLKNLEVQSASIPALIHPNAVIGKYVTIGSGTVVMAGVIINCESIIRKGCIINTSVIIGHDSVINEYVHVSSGALLGGTVTIGRKTWVGLGACIKNDISICGECIIGAGAVVVKNIVNPGTYIGVPAYKAL